MLVQSLIIPVWVHDVQTVNKAVVLSHENRVYRCETGLLAGPSITWSTSHYFTITVIIIELWRMTELGNINIEIRSLDG